MNKCTWSAPRGWYCKRNRHPGTEPCAWVPKWWNRRGRRMLSHG